MTGTADRLLGYISRYASLYPEALPQLLSFRGGRAQLGDWPEWCFVPLAGAYAAVSHVLDAAPIQVPPAVMGREVTVLGGLIAWVMERRVVEVAPDVLAGWWDAPVAGTLSVDRFEGLPGFCAYVEARQGAMWDGSSMLGFFVFLEWDMNHRRAELKFLVDTGDAAALAPVTVHLGGTLREGLRDMLRFAGTVGGLPVGRAEVDAGAARVEAQVRPLVAVALALCAGPVWAAVPPARLDDEGLRLSLLNSDVTTFRVTG